MGKFDKSEGKMNLGLKILIILAITAVLAFGVYNLVWLIFFSQHIKPFRDALEYDEMTSSYTSIDADKYSYNISYDYLRFGAELQVAEIQSDDPVQSLMRVTITSKGYDYNAVINYKKENSDGTVDDSYDHYNVHLNKEIQPIDSNGNVIENLSGDEKAQYDKAYPELKILFDKANAKWTELNS